MIKAPLLASDIFSSTKILGANSLDLLQLDLAFHAITIAELGIKSLVGSFLDA